jgi:hypothetical protein
MKAYCRAIPRVGRLTAWICLLTAALVATQAAADVLRKPGGGPELVFFGVVTVRDGKYVLFQNPDLKGDALEAAQCQLLESGILTGPCLADETASPSDRLLFQLGIGAQHVEGQGGEHERGDVPYRIYLISGAQSVSLDDQQIDPNPQRAQGMRTAQGCVEVQWWAPEAIESISFSTMYWFDTDCDVTARLEKKQLTVGAAGRTAYGVNWRIIKLSEEKNRIRIGLEASPAPQGKRLLVRLMTAEGEPIPCGGTSLSLSANPDTGVTTYDMTFTFGDENGASGGLIGICAPNPDRVKQLTIRDFLVSSKQEKKEGGATQNINDAESGAPAGETD